MPSRRPTSPKAQRARKRRNLAPTWARVQRPRADEPSRAGAPHRGRRAVDGGRRAAWNARRTARVARLRQMSGAHRWQNQSRDRDNAAYKCSKRESIFSSPSKRQVQVPVQGRTKRENDTAHSPAQRCRRAFPSTLTGRSQVDADPRGSTSTLCNLGTANWDCPN